MHGRRSALLLPVAAALAPVILAQTLSVPAFVVPAFADLTIRKRLSSGAPARRTEALYLKGARQRREVVYERQAGSTVVHYATITQCDKRRSVDLNLEARLYAVSVLPDWSRPSTRGTLPEERGADVTTTFDAVDTGERRQIGRYVARRVQTTITVEPSPGARTPASIRTIDGWYIDLPGLGCSDGEARSYLAVSEVVGPGQLRDRHHYTTKGTASRGYAIEETDRFTQAGRTHVDRVELIELSEDPVDASLFDVPRAYRPALPLVRGGHDLAKPDTIANRLETYWNELTAIASAIFR